MPPRRELPSLLHYRNQRMQLYRGVLCLSTEEECERFFIDLLSEPELYEVTKRFYIAGLLLREEKIPIRKVEEIVREEFGEASTTTIERVKRVLNGQASRGGYALVFEKLQGS